MINGTGMIDKWHRYDLFLKLALLCTSVECYNVIRIVSRSLVMSITSSIAAEEVSLCTDFMLGSVCSSAVQELSHLLNESSSPPTHSLVCLSY